MRPEHAESLQGSRSVPVLVFRSAIATMASCPGPIMVEASRTRRRLRELCLEVERRAASRIIPEGVDADGSHLLDCLDRLNIWAGSLGVFQKGEASLDSRLANHILAREVIRLLKQLDQFVSDRK